MESQSHWGATGPLRLDSEMLWKGVQKDGIKSQHNGRMRTQTRPKPRVDTWVTVQPGFLLACSPFQYFVSIHQHITMASHLCLMFEIYQKKVVLLWNFTQSLVFLFCFVFQNKNLCVWKKKSSIVHNSKNIPRRREYYTWLKNKTHNSVHNFIPFPLQVFEQPL